MPTKHPLFGQSGQYAPVEVLPIWKVSKDLYMELMEKNLGDSGVMKPHLDQNWHWATDRFDVERGYQSTLRCWVVLIRERASQLVAAWSLVFEESYRAPNGLGAFFWTEIAHRRKGLGKILFGAVDRLCRQQKTMFFYFPHDERSQYFFRKTQQITNRAVERGW